MICSENKKADCTTNQCDTTYPQIDYRIKRISRTKAIRLKCLDCEESPKEIRECISYDCPLWRFRTGKEERDDIYKLKHSNSSKSST